jgi:hypothetical protein
MSIGPLMAHFPHGSNKFNSENFSFAFRETFPEINYEVKGVKPSLDHTYKV